MAMRGFEFVSRQCGAGPTIKNVLGTGVIQLTKGDIVGLVAGALVLGTPAGVNILGVCLSTAVAAPGKKFPVIVDPDIVMSVKDLNVRSIGDTLDLAGLTGNMTVAPSVNKTFVVVEDSSAVEVTRVRFNFGKHHYNSAL